MDSDFSGDQFAAIGRSLSNEPGVTATLDYAVTTAQAIVGGCDHAGIALVVKGRKIRTVAQTDHAVAIADKLQQDVKEGPCIRAIAEQETIYIPDLRDEPRWQTWATQVSDETGIRCALSLQLFVGPTSLGALNLYSLTPNAFGVDDRVSALALAAHIAIAMTAAQDKEGAESALINRAVIAQAQGRLIERLDITLEQAFSAMVRVSQARNVKLHVVAADIVTNGIRPELFA